MPNRLADAASLYLRQHADNPVDWHPWGEEAFEMARAQNKPVFLSIGYSSCHWCHVMAHECFEDTEVAEALNRDYISIKVDREERPDVDDTYMTAVQLATSRGGWPMTLFLTPDRAPFFAGTYIPKHDRGGQAGFLNLCRQIAQVWKTQNKELVDSANEFAESLAETISSTIPVEMESLGAHDIEDAFRALVSDFDDDFGGFGNAPKFPPHSALDFLIVFAKSEFGIEGMRAKAAQMVEVTLDAMEEGGIHDHVGGGYHRYSTDAEWRLPHFEKTLYDNAAMLRNLVHAGRSGDDIVSWLTDEMLSPDGTFYAAIDADSEGEEGTFYTWTLAELQQAAPDIIKPVDATDSGNFFEESTRRRNGRNVLHFEKPTSFDRSKLKKLRANRVPPTTDAKSVVGWNGLVIWGLVEAGEKDLAQRAADAILAHSPLPRIVVDGRPIGQGYLEDYAYFCRGLIALGDPRANQLATEMVDLFWDEKDSAFFSTSGNHEALFGRHKPVFDNPLPSANAIAIECLALLGMTGKATAALNALIGWMHRAPNATEALYRAAMLLISPTKSTPPKLAAAPQTAQGDVQISVDWDRTQSAGTLTLTLPSGWHLDGKVLAAKTTSGILAIDLPTDKEVSGEFSIPFAVREKEAKCELIVTYQACNDSMCLLPMTRRFDL